VQNRSLHPPPARQDEGRCIIFGLGTGRCGTVSLFTLLNISAGSQAGVTHEVEPPERDRLLVWDGRSDLYRGRVAALLKMVLSREALVTGDIWSAYLPYADTILAMNPAAKLVVLERDQDDVVRSFLRKTRMHGPRRMGNEKYNKYFPPILGNETKEDFLVRYHSLYVTQTTDLVRRHPGRVHKFESPDVFNNATQMRALFDWLSCRHLDADAVAGKHIHRNA
jgi:hypothetical protein